MRRLLLLLAPLPALMVGVLVMQRSGVSPGIRGQQLAAGVILFALCAGVGFVPGMRRPWRFRGYAITTVAALLLLTATLVQPGLDGVRRWVPLGPLQLHAAFIALPVLLVVLARLREAGTQRIAAWCTLAATTVAAIVLALQPDASQATAFGVAVCVLLFRRRTGASTDWIAAGVILLGALAAWTRPDPLASVPYVEGIVGLAGNLGTVCLVSSLLALALLPIPFIADALARPRDDSASLAVAVYSGVVSSMPLVGPYPVPVLGFGLSPLVGYFGVLGWIVLRSREDQLATGAVAAKNVDIPFEPV
jgi:cell division protein FtsW (lipid II flippase)